MKKIKTLGLFLIVSLFAIQAKAVVGPNTVVIWPKIVVGPNVIVIWPIIQKSAQGNSTLMSTGNFSSDYSSSSNVYSISLSNGSFNYTVNQDNISTSVDDSNWPLGSYSGTVTFSNGDISPFTFTLTK